LLTKAMAEDPDHNLALLPGDELVIPSLPDSVYVFGAVNRPGPVAFKENRPVAHYIAEAGGPSGRARATRVGIFTTDLSRKAVEVKSTDPRIVQAGEVVYVPERVVKGFADYAQIIFVARAILAGINP
jgi:protein involved in polysaccharide export with SLBB domain